MPRLAWIVAALFASIGSFSSTASAQTYPSRTIEIIVPYNPGGSTDIIGRITDRRSRVDA